MIHVVIFDVIFCNFKLFLFYGPIQGSVALVVFGVDVIEAENFFVPNDNLEMVVICSHIQHGRFGSTSPFKNNWILVTSSGGD